MASTISSINNEIALCQKMIDQRTSFIAKLGTLKSNTEKTIENLSDASSNLKMGLTLGNQSADNGKLEEYYTSLKKSLSKIDEASTVATKEIRQYEDNMSTLKAQKRRLEAEESRRQTLEYRGDIYSNDKSISKLPGYINGERNVDKL